MQIEGKNAVAEAVAAQQKIDRLYLAKGTRGERAQTVIDAVRETGGRVEFFDTERLDRMSVTKHHQGWIALTRDYEYATLGDVFAGERGHRLVLMLDGINDPHNLGAIIRVAECGGADGIVIPERRSAAVNETVIRVAAGASANMKVARVGNLNDAIRAAQDDGFTVYGAELGGEDIYGSNLTGDIVLVIGSEGDGLHRLTRELCDAIVTLPVYGHVNSLNASVACGVVLYEAIRQRRS